MISNLQLIGLLLLLLLRACVFREFCTNAKSQYCSLSLSLTMSQVNTFAHS